MPGAGALIATFVAGLLAFLSPCTVPLIPAYLSVVSGVSVTDTSARSGFGGRLVVGSLLYVAGFATVLVVLGVGAGSLSQAILTHRRAIEVVGGTLVALLGLFILGVVRLPFLNRDIRLELPARLRGGGPVVAYPIGVIFAVGWTPCSGPYLGAALVLAAASGTALKGGILLFVYALGLGLPFIAIALAWASIPQLPRRVRRIAGPLTLVGGALTFLLGISLATGLYVHVTSFFAQFSSR